LNEFVKSITDGARRKCPWGAKSKVPYTPAENQRNKKAQWFFRDEAIHVVYRVPEKLLKRSRGTFYDAIKIVILENEQADRGSH